ncbi:MAG: fumarylacetoacetate hydrolase family protein, partial [Deltaproteobacteria bacterium]|nr:fumarylacetoacetate hydrolase family protein [Deltaproteobacteria bacterium]
GDHLNFVTEGAEILWPTYTQALDYEIEIGFVITKPLMNASAEEALQAIGGFVIVNDISARDVQLAEMGSGFGPQKSKHFINVMSSQVVTADEILPRINRLKAEIRINGKTVRATGSDFRHHSIADALVHVSKGAQLHPGELFATGTLPGGCALENDNWLKVGDRIELFIDRIGALTNTIVG